MDNNDFSYGIIKYSSINIGDEIQSVASSRFLPRVDEYVHRERIGSFIPKTGKKTKLIMNAWWMWEVENFPPSDYIDPLLISMYIREEKHKEFLTAKTKDYLLKYGPVGCRDKATCDWLNSEDIPAYFSGCLTLTLQRNWKIFRENYVLCVDTPKDVVEEIKKRTKRPVYNIHRMITPYFTAKQRFKIARIMLRLYHNAHCVVSPRLHVILPSLALETPVLRLTGPRKIIGVEARYTGYEDCVNSVSIDEFMQNKHIYNFEHPKKNPKNYKPIRENLIKKCSEFTGCNKTKPFINRHVNPALEMINLSAYDYKQVKRIAYWLKTEDLEQILTDRKNGINQHDLKF